MDFLRKPTRVNVPAPMVADTFLSVPPADCRLYADAGGSPGEEIVLPARLEAGDYWLAVE